MNLDNFLVSVIKKGASDIHFQVGRPPILRVYGELTETDSEVLTPKDTNTIVFKFLNKSENKRLDSLTEIDTTYTIEGKARFRVHIYKQQGTYSIALRYIPLNIPSMDHLGIPKVVKKIIQRQRGLFLVTGVTGSGKTTTLASLINRINNERRDHIITIEDPIEFVFNDKRSFISQREVGIDTPSFLTALKAAMREDPDVILIGEMRAPETIATAIRAAETGHLVFSTFHTSNAKETVESIISYFPPRQATKLRSQLASNLLGMISQRLIPMKGKRGRVLAAEILRATPTIKSCILDQDKIKEIPSHMIKGASEYGMQTFDQSVMKLYKKDLISKKDAIANASSVSNFKRALEYGEESLLD